MSGARTPGPWSVDQQSHRGMVVVTGPDGEHIAYVTGETVAQQLRDARSIAALPELLAALQELKRHWPGIHPRHTAIIDAAIAKATGAAS